MPLRFKVTQNNTGRYRRILLDHLFGSKHYSVASMSVDPDYADKDNIQSLIDQMRADKRFTLINQTDDNLTTLLLHDQEKQGWMKALEEEGIEIEASPKTPKRITALTRHVYLGVVRDFRDGDEEIPVVMVEPDAFSDHKIGDTVSFFSDPVDRRASSRKALTLNQATMFLDGGSVISREIVEEMIEDGARFIEQHLHNPHDTVVNRDVDNVFSGQVRLIGPNGQIKGDTLISDRESMARALEDAGYELPECGYVDVISIDDNLKHEVSWSNGQYLFFEPHGKQKASDAQEKVKHQYTDQQYLCWMRDWLFDHNSLVMTHHEYINHIVRKLSNGDIPAYFQRTGKLEDPTSTIERFQYTALMYERYGLGIKASISLLNRIMNGAIKQLNKNNQDPKFPVPCSMYAHVATDSWLRACGRPEEDWPNERGFTPRGYLWYDEMTDRMIYNDLDFVEDYERHGGFDLDDAIKYFARTWQGTRVWVAVRSPNTYGEYSIRRHIQGEFAPVWKIGDHEAVEFPEVPDERPKFIDEFEVDYEFEDLNFAIDEYEEFNKDYVAERMLNASRFFGLFGRYVNLDMVYHGTFGEPQLKQLAPLEEVVDASTQNPSATARDLIAKDVEERARVLEKLSFNDDVKLDEQLWDRRGDRRRQPKKVSSWFSRLNDEARATNSAAVVKIRRLSQEAVKHVPDIIHELGEKQRSVARKIIHIAYRNMAQRGRIKKQPDETPAHFHGRINDELIRALRSIDAGDHVLHDILMAMASECYSNKRNRTEYNDTILFYRSNTLSGINILDLWLDAISYYKIPDYAEDPEAWIDDFHCGGCNVTTVVFDPLMKQCLGYEPCQHIDETELPQLGDGS